MRLNRDPVTRERVRQIEAKAVRKLQQPYRSRELMGFLDDERLTELDLIEQWSAASG